MIYNNFNQSVIDEIRKSEGFSYPRLIKDLIKSNLPDRMRMEELWREYNGDVPIKSKTNSTNPIRLDNRCAHDFRGTIIQQIVGYLFGTPVKISISEDDPNQKAGQDILDSFNKKNHTDKLDSELETYVATCGKGYRLLYYINSKDATGKSTTELIMKNIKSYEALIIEDATTQEPALGMIYYQMEIASAAQGKKYRYKVEIYDNKNVYYFIEAENGEYVPDTMYGDSTQEHGFDYIPLIKFSNNTIERGDFEKVRTLIDSYDKIVSFGLADSESYALAYLIFYGVEPTAEVLEQVRRTGALYIPKDNDADANNRVEFLTKDMNMENLTELTNLLNNDIYRFSSTVDMSDEKFSGAAQSGESRKYKLFPLETKAKEKERLWKESLERLYKVVTSFWKFVKNVNINPENIEFVFNRTVPLDLSYKDLIDLYNAGLITKESAVAQIKFIENVDDEVGELDDAEVVEAPEPVEPIIPIVQIQDKDTKI